MNSHLDGAEQADPIAWFQASFARASTLESFDASRAALATASANAVPSVRFVLVKRVDQRGFVFYTNYESRKASELIENPRAALAFHWPSIGEQVRVAGQVRKLSDAESDAYFATRPRLSQLGAWASAQSQPVADRETLDAKYAAQEQRFAAGVEVPRPKHWGGFVLVPDSIEYWHDRAGRLHDRWLFSREASAASSAGSAGWQLTRLQP